MAQRPLELLGTVGPVTGGRVDAGGGEQAQVLVVAQGADGQPGLAGQVADGQPLHGAHGDA
jgi:hypothetical protein